MREENQNQIRSMIMDNAKIELFMVLVVCLTVLGLATILTSCDKNAQRELTKRQYIAGTNVLTGPWQNQ